MLKAAAAITCYVDQLGQGKEPEYFRPDSPKSLLRGLNMSLKMARCRRNQKADDAITRCRFIQAYLEG